MSAAQEVREPAARYMVTLQPAPVQQFDRLAGADGGMVRLRQLILSLAFQGRLVPQNPEEEPANLLVSRLVAERVESKSRRRKVVEAGAEGDVELIAAQPSSWCEAPLTAIAIKLTDGSHNPPTDAGTGFPMLSSQNVLDDGTIDFGAPSRYVSVADFERENARTGATPGDVLLTIVASLGRSAVVPNDAPRFLLQRSVAVIRTGLNPSYLAMFLRSPAARAFYDEHGKGTAQRGIYLGKLGELRVPIAPLGEQARIVARVDELMRLCDALEEKGRLEAEQHARLLSTLLGTLTDSATPEELAANWQRVAEHFDLLLDRPEAVDELDRVILDLAVQGKLVPQDPSEGDGHEYLATIRAGLRRRDVVEPVGDVEAAMTPMPIGWSPTRLGEVIELISGQHLAPDEYSEGLGHGIPYLTGPAEFGSISPQPTRSTRERRAVARQGDILITVKGAGVGKLNIVEHEELAISRQLMAVRVGESSRDFVWLQLMTMAQHFRAQSVGIAIPGIGRRDIERAVLGWPPIAEQRRIVARVTELRRLCATLRQRLQAQQATQSRLAEALVEQALA